MYCHQCGEQVDYDAKFCSTCGRKLTTDTNNEYEHTNEFSSNESSIKNITDQVKDAFLHTTEKINEMVGEKGNIDLKLSDIFSDVFKKHSKKEGERLFISGTEVTTPKEEDISSSWPKPWLFSRVFLGLALTFVLLYVSAYTLSNPNAIPGLIFTGAFAVPFSLLIFFWETNVPRNISIYEIAKMFFIGGAASLLATLIIYSIFPVFELDYVGAISVGIIEEIGKLVIIVYFIKKLNTKYILNGLLIGAAIGAGFAAFESAGYAFNLGISFGIDYMISNIFDRAWLSIGGHVVWSAIAGAALAYVKGSDPFHTDLLTDQRFLQLFFVPVILHSIWDMPLYALHEFYLLFLILIVVAWIFIFTLIHAGLKQISRLNNQTDEQQAG